MSLFHMFKANTESNCQIAEQQCNTPTRPTGNKQPLVTLKKCDMLCFYALEELEHDFKNGHV